ncbi:MAG TPA: hypothetical protein VMW15_00625 [Terracidiphilus sp.]|jgi:hypothetical protein|nr:hypothetical protein [Terracidiphilus sp.]
MEPLSPGELGAPPKRGVKEILKSYFFWTYPRGCFHYDVMVTLILVFIFVSPHLWNYGDKPSSSASLRHPIQLTGDGNQGMIVTVQASDINVPAGESDATVKKALRQAILPVTGDAVVVERWETITDAQGNLAWKIWAHR